MAVERVGLRLMTIEEPDVRCAAVKAVLEERSDRARDEEFILGGLDGFAKMASLRHWEDLIATCLEDFEDGGSIEGQRLAFVKVAAVALAAIEEYSA